MTLQVTKSKIGNAEIIQIVECEVGHLLKDLLPDATPEQVKTIGWLKPPYRREDYSLSANSQCFIVKINNRILVVDTCVGNDKSIEDFPEWNQMQTDFLETLESISLDRNSVTDVLCTHLHVDHVGWNTYKKDGQWLPTFPNAKYHFAKTEYDYWKNDSQNDPMAAIAATSFRESVDPVVAAELVNFIDVNADLGDGITIFSTPGHTPSHISVAIDAGDEKFIIGGDMSHHPCQIAKPEWAMTLDFDNKQAAETRRKVLSELAGTPILFTCIHYKIPSFGLVTQDHDGNFIFNTMDKSE